MKADDIRRQNEKYYYSSYVWPVWMHHRGVIFGICVMMTVVSMCVKQTFLKHKYILEASRQELGQTDVMRWVNAQVSAHRFDYMFIFILAANLIAWGFVVFFMFRYKSYEQYKKKWIKRIPMMIYFAELVIFWTFYGGGQILVGAIAMTVEFIPVICATQFLFPLENRPGMKKVFNLLELFGALVNGIWKKKIKKM